MRITKESIISDLDKLYEDTSVSPATTLNNLEIIRDEIDAKIDGLKQTMSDDAELEDAELE